MASKEVEVARAKPPKRDALLTFAGEQDVTTLARVLSALDEMQMDENSCRELCVRPSEWNGCFEVAYKKELTV